MTTPTLRKRLQAYFDAWNDHSPAAVTEAFAPGGTYSDPTCNGCTIPASNIAEHVGQLAESFPDFMFETDEPGWSDDRTAQVPWLLRGTNTGSYAGLPPTGRTIELPGVDVIEVGDDGVRRVTGHFDRQTLSTQLGLQVLVQPAALGPFRFGYSVGVFPERSTPPGAVAMTWIEARSEQEADEVRERSRPVMAALHDVPGFIGAIGVGIGTRLYTITAWEDHATIGQLLELPEHREAVRRFLDHDFSAGAFTGSWPNSASRSWWIRCPHCSTLNSGFDDTDHCSSCQTPLPEQHPL